MAKLVNVSRPHVQERFDTNKETLSLHHNGMVATAVGAIAADKQIDKGNSWCMFCDDAGHHNIASFGRMLMLISTKK